MRHQGIVWSCATVAILGATACFSPPTGTKATSPSRITVSEFQTPGSHSQLLVGTLTFANLKINDTLVLGIQVQDNTGYYYAFSAPTFSTSNSAVADLVAFPDSILGVVPGNTLYKALLIGKGAGTTSVQVQASGLSDSVAVKVQ